MARWHSAGVDDHVEINRADWNEPRAQSPDYEFDRFINDPSISATSSGSTARDSVI